MDKRRSDNRLIIDFGSQNDNQRLALATRSGACIPNARRRERAPDSLVEAVRMWKAALPDAELRSMSAVYNCMGMVFGCRRTWIEPQHLKNILDGDGYEKLKSIWYAERGDVAVYRNHGEVSHVGIVIRIDADLQKGEKTLCILSQWGEDGEWFHPHDCVPHAFGQISEIWTDRRRI